MPAMHAWSTALDLVSYPAPPRTCEKGGSGVLNDFSCHSSPIRELESDCRTSSSTRSSMPAVRCTCTENAIITFFTPFDPTPYNKKCRSKHQTLFSLFKGGVWGRDYSRFVACALVSFPDQLAWERDYMCACIQN